MSIKTIQDAHPGRQPRPAFRIDAHQDPEQAAGHRDDEAGQRLKLATPMLICRLGYTFLPGARKQQFEIKSPWAIQSTRKSQTTRNRPRANATCAQR
jgi:hypothetical protein